MNEPMKAFMVSNQPAVEQQYAVMLTQWSDISVRFSTAVESALTDGVNIIINPQSISWYTDNAILSRLCAAMGLPRSFSDPLAALCTIVRGLNI